MGRPGVLIVEETHEEEIQEKTIIITEREKEIVQQNRNGAAITGIVGILVPLGIIAAVIATY